MPNKKEKICDILDKLTIDALILLEKNIQMKMNIEENIEAGNIHLAKSRYIAGHSKISTLQVPKENTIDIQPMTTIMEYNVEFKDSSKHLELEVNKCEQKYSENNSMIVNPIKWFGLLTPQSLQIAQTQFLNACLWAAKCANAQIQLHNVINYILKLTKFKCILQEKL